MAHKSVFRAGRSLYVAGPGVHAAKPALASGASKGLATVATWEEYPPEMHTTLVVHEDGEDELQFIGLFDHDGDPLYRASERIPIGFDLARKPE